VVICRLRAAPSGGASPRNSEHAARAARAVIEQVAAGLEAIRDGQEDERGHEADGVAGRPVFAGLLVVLLVELADEFLETVPIE